MQAIVVQVLEDESEEVEVRVAAFQALLKCAHQDPTFFKRIRTLLLEEKVNQGEHYCLLICLRSISPSLLS